MKYWWMFVVWILAASLFANRKFGEKTEVKKCRYESLDDFMTRTERIIDRHIKGFNGDLEFGENFDQETMTDCKKCHAVVKPWKKQKWEDK